MAKEINFDALVEALADRLAVKVMERVNELMAQADENDIISRKEIIRKLGVSQTTLWRWEKDGTLIRSGSFGRRVYYHRQDVERALQLSRN
jgi:predicted DNA-binding transcriptional regulator AlpA